MAVETDNLQQRFNRCVDNGEPTYITRQKLNISINTYNVMLGKWLEGKTIARILEQSEIDKNREFLKNTWEEINRLIARYQFLEPSNEKLLLERELDELIEIYSSKSIFQ